MNYSLRPAALSDVALMRLWHADPANAEFFRRCPPAMFLTDAAYVPDKYMVEKAGEVIGMIMLGGYDLPSKSCEFGMLLTGHHYADTAQITRDLCKVVFNYLGYNRLTCRVLCHREKLKQRLAEFGFRKEGTLWEGAYMNGSFVDEDLFAITKQEFVKWHS